MPIINSYFKCVYLILFDTRFGGHSFGGPSRKFQVGYPPQIVCDNSSRNYSALEIIDENMFPSGNNSSLTAVSN